MLKLAPHLPKGWKSFSFNINYRGCHLKIKVSDNIEITASNDLDYNISLYDKIIIVVKGINIFDKR
jgi:maltose phosphorylase